MEKARYKFIIIIIITIIIIIIIIINLFTANIMPQQILVEEKFWFFQYFALSNSEWLTRPKLGEVPAGST